MPTEKKIATAKVELLKAQVFETMSKLDVFLSIFSHAEFRGLEDVTDDIRFLLEEIRITMGSFHDFLADLKVQVVNE